MGFSGIIVVARSARPLSELDSMPAHGGSPLWSGADEEWQAMQFADAGSGPPPPLLAETGAPTLLAETGAPTLVARVVNDSFAMVRAASPTGVGWAGVLGPAAAERHPLPVEFLAPPEDVVEPALGWARAGGLAPDVDRLEDVLQAEPDPTATELVFELLSALGFTFSR